MRHKQENAIKAPSGMPQAKGPLSGLHPTTRLVLVWALIIVVVFSVPLWVGGSINPCQAAVNAIMPPGALAWAMSEHMWQQEGLIACYSRVLNLAFNPPG